ncbi:MAG TPA: hypothetical protein VGL58_03555 [Caulobacteraceae bacterium]
MEVVLEIGGTLPYNERLKVLDLLTWRVTERIEEIGYELAAQGLLPRAALDDAQRGRRQAFSRLNAERAVSFDIPFHLYGLDRDPPYPDVKSRDRVFYPVLARSHAQWLDQIVEAERLALPASALALAAGGIQSFDVTELRTTNPLTIRAGLTSIATLLGALTVAGSALESHHMHAEGDHLRQVCDKIGDEYANSLSEPLPKFRDRQEELVGAFKTCVDSPIFSAAPISIQDVTGGKKD